MTKADIVIAKNYLTHDEVGTLELLVGQYLDFAELAAKRKKAMYMKDWIDKLDDFLKINEQDILTHAGNGISGKHDKYNLAGENIIIGRVGAKCGNVRLVNGNIGVIDNAFYISDFFEDFDLRFLEYVLNLGDLRATANQAAPPVSEQHSIVAKRDALSLETKKLEAIYQQKLADLDELKKSVLQKAFDGEL